MGRYILKNFYSKKTIKDFNEKLNLLGLENKYDAVTVLNLRTLSSIIIFFVILYISKFGYVFAPIVTFLYFMLFKKIFLDSKIKKRETALEKDGIYFFEILTLSLETGRNLEAALNITIKNTDSALSKEFKEALRGLKYGKSLTECLESIPKFIPSESINNIILSLTHANIFGNSIIDSLYSQIDYIREKRILETKAEISKIPIKISVISVLFFVPLILLIVLSPVLLNYLH